MARPMETEIKRELQEAWEALESAVQSFSSEEMERPGVVGSWSMKDLLGHIAFWTNQATQNLQLVASGRGDTVRRPGNERTTAEWNERERQLRRDRPVETVRREWLESFEEVRGALESLPAEMLEDDVGGRTVASLFAEDTSEHYREHVEHVRAWRLRAGKPGT